ncbi:ComF family protein [Candidatus Latescibacterota bacterium]
MNIGYGLYNVFHSLIDFLFPPECPVCGGSFSAKEIICHTCIEAITDCSYQYTPSKRVLTDIDEISILLPYNPVCRNLIHALKYHGMHSTGFVLGKLMARKIIKECSLPEKPCIVPVPLHLTKLSDRGYNQSEHLAEGFSSFTGYEICSDLITRQKNTNTQTALDHEDRILNVRDAFRYTGERSLSGRPVILIDDVMTTGSTVSECAKALKEGGAGKITVCVVATPDIGMD